MSWGGGGQKVVDEVKNCYFGMRKMLAISGEKMSSFRVKMFFGQKASFTRQKITKS